MNCCAECFGDRGLRRDIIPPRSSIRGRCDYCNTDGVGVIEPRELALYFELLVSAYRPDPTGKPLIYWFREDWALFQHPRMLDDAIANDLLGQILDDKDIVCDLFVPANGSTRDLLSEWEVLRDELMHHNRYFPEKTIDQELLEALLAPLTRDADELPTSWYRARIQAGGEIYAADQMGAPPNTIVSHGRANPAGIPYLYLGSDPDTAISEIRPHTGEIACVANFSTQPLKLVDLCSPREVVSPFVLTDSDEVGRMRNDLSFLERLGGELTRPVIPQSAAIDYTPSQYLCEFIKKCGYQGVVYRSSVSAGTNLTLFDPSQATCGSIDQYRIARVSVKIEPYKA
jgi:hypothetical protein